MKKFIAKDEQGRFFSEIADKVDTDEILQDNQERSCPPHWLPHTLPLLQPKYITEPCHIHLTEWRQQNHHEPACKRYYGSFGKCPHYEDMRQALELQKESPKHP